MKFAKHLIFFVGLFGLAYGCWLIYHPAGWIASGLLTVWSSFLLDSTDK